ncbi:MAG: TIGR00730 family Rossman fold protein [Bacteroidetes bacterium]|nr:TIGR00730 family Rossman fold protein [Bacteroidota bacterium]
MKAITVFCGSNSGFKEVYQQQAFLLGKKLAGENIGVVYGGARIGLMGAVADGALQNGGKVYGVIPEFLRSKEIAHEGLTELILVTSMHERKVKMNELSDGVIALPGGFGTMEELFEMLTWAQLGLHKKPIALLNTNSFYDYLIRAAETMVIEGFLKKSNLDILLVDDQIDSLLKKMKAYRAPEVPKWIDLKTS